MGGLVKSFIRVRDRIQKQTCELIESKEEADRANKAKSVFLSSMSHEIRTPLNSILDFSQILASDNNSALNESQRDSIRRITQAGDHLLELISDVLDLAKIESEKLHVDITDVDVGEVAKSTVASVEHLAQTYGITTKSQIPNPTERFFVKTDETRLTQILTNLMSNAIKYNKKDGEATISISDGSDGMTKISVIDNGSGISKEKIGTLFMPFDRLGMEGLNIYGTGIGLTIVKKLTEIMDGAIEVESEIESGSKFHIFLHKGSSPQLTQEGKATTANDQSRPIARVLYIEDNPDNMELVRMILDRHTSYEMTGAVDAKSGIEKARSQRRNHFIGYQHSRCRWVRSPENS